MIAIGDTSFEYDIPPWVTGSRGLDFYVTTEGTANRVSRWPNQFFRSIRVQIPEGVTVAAEGGTEATNYRLVSFPLFLDAENAATVLEDDLGPYDRKKWRFVQHVESTRQNRELGTHEITIRPGDTYWLLVKDAGRVL